MVRVGVGEQQRMYAYTVVYAADQVVIHSGVYEYILVAGEEEAMAVREPTLSWSFHKVYAAADSAQLPVVFEYHGDKYNRGRI